MTQDLSRRHVLGLAAGGLGAALIPAAALAQTAYPSKPVTLIVSYAAGGGTDAIARIFAARLEKALGGRVIVENRPGAAANTGTEVAAAAAADGHTLLIGNQGPMVVNPHLFKLKADPAVKLEPIALIANAGLVVVVGPRLKVGSLEELVAAAKTKELVYGSAGNASASHLGAILLEQTAGIQMKHVPYKGAGPAVNDLVGGHIDLMVTTIPSAIGLIESKTLTALAVTTEQRFPTLPDVPTAVEAGVPGYSASAWYGLMGPKGLPADVRAKLEKATVDALTDPELLDRLKSDGATPAALGAAAFAKFMAEERTRWGQVVKSANISIE